MNNGSETVLAEFEGDYFTDYLQDGKYLVNKKTLTVTDLLTGASSTLGNIDLIDADFVSVNPDGSRFVFGFTGEENSNGTKIQGLIYCSADGSEPAAFSEPLLFEESCGFVWLDASSVMSVRASDGSGANAGSVVYTF